MDVGTTVYIRNCHRINCIDSKLEPQCIGPYEIVESLDKGRVRLKNLWSGQKLNNLYHGSNLKVYNGDIKEDSSTSDSTDATPPKKQKR